MNGAPPLTPRWPALLLTAILLVAAGAASTYWLLRPRLHSPAGASDVQRAHASHSNETAARPENDAASHDMHDDPAVILTPEAVARARIATAPVGSGTGGPVLRLPARVEANAYKEVAVTPLVDGRVTKVFVELGQSVRRGQPLAEIFSPELAEAKTAYVSARAELDAHERELERTQKLFAIGAATRQELERLHAEHTARLAGVQTALSRLELLGVPAAAVEGLAPGKDLSAVTTVPAPIAGVVIERTANAGLNVDTTAKLFTVVDLSNVWIVAGLYEKDFARVRVGSPATVTTTAYPGMKISGHVSYIDPQVDPDTRTARLRIEVPNPRADLRLAMYVDVTIQAAGSASVIVISRSAVQHAGARTVVYLADPEQPGRFTEREVRLGDPSGNEVPVLAGLQAGDTIVTEGSFFLRAERERSGHRD
jgi:RND family efflux transporter MFP subunit